MQKHTLELQQICQVDQFMPEWKTTFFINSASKRSAETFFSKVLFRHLKLFYSDVIKLVPSVSAKLSLWRFSVSRKQIILLIVHFSLTDYVVLVKYGNHLCVLVVIIILSNFTFYLLWMNSNDQHLLVHCGQLFPQVHTCCFPMCCALIDLTITWMYS